MKTIEMKFFLFIISLFFSTGIFAQESKTGNWFIYIGNQKISKNLTFWNEAQYRNYNVIGDLQQLLLRTGIGYNLTENNNNLLIGYGYILSENYTTNDKKTALHEHRTYLQFLTRHKAGRVNLLHRYRAEQRFFEEDVQHRFRYFLSVNLPLNHKEMIEKTIYLSLYNEIFIHANKEHFDRNRAYGAIGYLINKNLRMELGFMNQYTSKVSRNQFQIVVFNNLPLIK